MWCFLAALGLVSMIGCGRTGDHEVKRIPASKTLDGNIFERKVEIVPRTPYLSTFPCAAQCHSDREPNPTPRELVTFHAGRTLQHGPALRWCDDCHSIQEPDKLMLRDQTKLSFDDSDRICGQCHGEQHREWRSGIHGSNVGGWTGTIRRRTCAACHDPHRPSKPTLQALPAPKPDPRLSP